MSSDILAGRDDGVPMVALGDGIRQSLGLKAMRYRSFPEIYIRYNYINGLYVFHSKLSRPLCVAWIYAPQAKYNQELHNFAPVKIFRIGGCASKMIRLGFSGNVSVREENS
jgi:hypothetical protein